MKKILYTKSALPFILKAFGIKTDISHDKILGIGKNEDNTPRIITNEIDLLIEYEKNKMKRKR